MSGQKLTFILFVAILAFTDAAHHEQDNDEGNIYFRTFKRLGKFVFRRRKPGGRKQDLGKNGFQLELRYLKQKDGSGGETGEQINTFADHTFNLTSFNKTAKVDGVDAADIKATTNLKRYNAKLSVRIIIFKAEGNVTFGNESYGVQTGTIKLFIKVENFTFCDGTARDSKCKQNVMGESLEIAIRVRNRKGEKGKQETEDEKNKREGPFKPGSVKKQRLRCFKQRNQSKCPRIFLFGNDEVGVASQCKTDGTFRSQVEGFPKLVEQGNQQMLLFRGPRFNRTITFDPVMELTEDDDGDGNGNGNGDGNGDGDGDGNGDNENHASTMCINVFMFVAVLGTLFL
ncbi:PREDICTED: skeletal aspartic acid-rich protein 1-like isoform X3 [Acropora digitifera]|uniref:skeletal aspartic acid-rich protein 1-like isoform X3 n=1 Tax=Acropora digitifera TaxID=70779 RepID=UPI00077A8DAF|nr:PREDICTED: skeletal aspartic acid-rich protein 1-like isoform X3 [Acropora digitifera]